MLNHLKLTTVRILSIDGGGIRGLIPAMMLREIRRRLDALGKRKPFHRIFDLMAGTSTGGLITLGLSTPTLKDANRGRRCTKPVLSVDELVSLYKSEGQRIFPQKSNVLVNTLVHAMQHKYDAGHLEAVLEEKLGTATLQEALTNVLVTSYDIERREPHLFIRRPPTPGGREEPDFAVKDVARATSAAPTYFEPAYLQPIPPDGTRYALIDGGVFANNPALLAYIEAKRTFPNATRFVILSLGTGIVDKPYRYDEVKDWGYIDWMAAFRGLPLFSMMMDGQSDAAVSVLRDFPGVKLFRFDPHIDEKHAFMDDAGPDNITYLERRATDLIGQASDELDELCHRL